MTLLYIDCGHFGFELHIQCPFVYTTDALHKGDTQHGGKRRWNNLFSVTIFRPFYNMEQTHNPGLIRLLPPPPPPFFFSEDQTLLSQASRDLKLISPLLMNAKITHHVTWRRESCMLFPLNFSQSKKKIFVCLHCYLKKCNVCFWLSEQAKLQGKPFSLEDNKNVLDGNELTQSCSLVCVFSFSQLLTPWRACKKNKCLSYRSISVSFVLSWCMFLLTATVQSQINILH